MRYGFISQGAVNFVTGINDEGFVGDGQTTESWAMNAA
jgi:hypothetical protein